MILNWATFNNLIDYFLNLKIYLWMIKCYHLCMQGRLCTFFAAMHASMDMILLLVLYLTIFLDAMFLIRIKACRVNMIFGLLVWKVISMVSLWCYFFLTKENIRSHTTDPTDKFIWASQMKGLKCIVSMIQSLFQILCFPGKISNNL